LAPATRLPSTRVLAADLGVSRRLVVDAYSQLTAEGFLLSRHGSGTRVATVDTASAPERDAGEAMGHFDIDFAPGLRIGWMVLPANLVGPVALSKGRADTGSSVMDQIAFAKLLTTGGYDRHLRQMRRRYLLRRNALLRALARYLPEATVLGAAAAVHLTVQLPDGCPVADLVRRAAEMRVRVDPLAPCYAEAATAPPGLMLGYANLSESQIVTGVQALARAMGGRGTRDW
jgi:DNA-binding transcriptional MocR family regulator